MKSKSIILLGLLLAACGPKGLPVPEGAVTVPDRVAPDALLPLIRSIELVPLETRDESLLALNDLLPASDGYIAVDRRNNRLLHFAADGRFLNTVGMYGRGPQEYGNLSTLQVQDGLVRVFSHGRNHLTTFREDGTFVSQETTPESAMHWWTVPEGSLVYPGYYTPETALLKLLRTDGTKEELLPKRVQDLIVTIGGTVFSAQGEDVFFFPDWAQAVYRYRAGTLEPWLEMDFGPEGIGDEVYDAADVWAAVGEKMKAGFSYVFRYFESDRLRLVVCAHERQPEGTRLVESVYKNGLFLDGKWIWFGQTEDDLIHWKILYLEGDALVCSAPPADLLELDPVLRDKVADRSALKALSEEDNDVIVKIHLK